MFTGLFILVMEQAHAGKGHDHSLLVALLNDQIITDRAAGLCDVLNTGGKCTLNVSNHFGIGAILANFLPKLVFSSAENSGILCKLLGDLIFIF